MGDNKIMYKGTEILESQITFLIEDRKQLLKSLHGEVRKNKRYEKIIGFLIAVVFIISVITGLH